MCLLELETREAGWGFEAEVRVSMKLKKIEEWVRDKRNLGIHMKIQVRKLKKNGNGGGLSCNL